MADNGGFTFAGVAINTLGLEYAPEKSETYVYKPATSNVHQEVFDSHDGGYYYGSSRQPKTFTLKCYYFLQEIDEGLMYKIYKNFPIGKKGNLIFDRRPWLTYKVVITKVDTADLKNRLNGTITITATCYKPFGYATITQNTETEGTAAYNSIKNNSTILTPTEYAALPANPTGPYTSDTHFHFYNGGTVNAKPLVKIKGDIPNNTSIANLTTGKAITLAAVNTGTNTLCIDCDSGKVYMEDTSGNKTFAFLYHKTGFIEIQPSEVTTGTTTNTLTRYTWTSPYSFKLLKNDASNALKIGDRVELWRSNGTVYYGYGIIKTITDVSYALSIGINKGDVVFPSTLYNDDVLYGICESAIPTWDDILLHVPDGGSITSLEMEYQYTFD